MAHKDWCGKPCVICSSPCALDECIPCSLDCENLLPDGLRDITSCFHTGCDVSAYRMCGFCYKVNDIINKDEQRDLILNCEECSTDFCENCFRDNFGTRALHDLVSTIVGGNIKCPACYRKTMRISKHFKPDSAYECKVSGHKYTVDYKPHIRGYSITRLQTNGDRIANSGFVSHKWMRRLKYVGPLLAANYEEGYLCQAC